MNTVIIIISSVAAIVGIGVSIWSIIDTRKRYGDAYKRKKRRARD